MDGDVITVEGNSMVLNGGGNVEGEGGVRVVESDLDYAIVEPKVREEVELKKSDKSRILMDNVLLRDGGSEVIVSELITPKMVHEIRNFETNKTVDKDKLPFFKENSMDDM